jgi:hypothetical protein
MGDIPQYWVLHNWRNVIEAPPVVLCDSAS